MVAPSQELTQASLLRRARSKSGLGSGILFHPRGLALSALLSVAALWGPAPASAHASSGAARNSQAVNTVSSQSLDSLRDVLQPAMLKETRTGLRNALSTTQDLSVKLARQLHTRAADSAAALQGRINALQAPKGMNAVQAQHLANDIRIILRDLDNNPGDRYDDSFQDVSTALRDALSHLQDPSIFDVDRDFTLAEIETLNAKFNLKLGPQIASFQQGQERGGHEVKLTRHTDSQRTKRQEVRGRINHHYKQFKNTVLTMEMRADDIALPLRQWLQEHSKLKNLRQFEKMDELANKAGLPHSDREDLENLSAAVQDFRTLRQAAQEAARLEQLPENMKIEAAAQIDHALTLMNSTPDEQLRTMLSGLHSDLTLAHVNAVSNVIERDMRDWQASGDPAARFRNIHPNLPQIHAAVGQAYALVKLAEEVEAGSMSLEEADVDYQTLLDSGQEASQPAAVHGESQSSASPVEAPERPTVTVPATLRPAPAAPAAREAAEEIVLEAPPAVQEGPNASGREIDEAPRAGAMDPEKAEPSLPDGTEAPAIDRVEDSGSAPSQSENVPESSGNQNVPSPVEVEPATPEGGMNSDSDGEEQAKAPASQEMASSGNAAGANEPEAEAAPGPGAAAPSPEVETLIVSNNAKNETNNTSQVVAPDAPVEKADLKASSQGKADPAPEGNNALVAVASNLNHGPADPVSANISGAESASAVAQAGGMLPLGSPPEVPASNNKVSKETPVRDRVEIEPPPAGISDLWANHWQAITSVGVLALALLIKTNTKQRRQARKDHRLKKRTDKQKGRRQTAARTAKNKILQTLENTARTDGVTLPPMGRWDESNAAVDLQTLLVGAPDLSGFFSRRSTGKLKADMSSAARKNLWAKIQARNEGKLTSDGFKAGVKDVLGNIRNNAAPRGAKRVRVSSPSASKKAPKPRRGTSFGSWFKGFKMPEFKRPAWLPDQATRKANAIIQVLKISADKDGWRTKFEVSPDSKRRLKTALEKAGLGKSLKRKDIRLLSQDACAKFREELRDNLSLGEVNGVDGANAIGKMKEILTSFQSTLPSLYEAQKQARQDAKTEEEDRKAKAQVAKGLGQLVEANMRAGLLQEENERLKSMLADRDKELQSLRQKVDQQDVDIADLKESFANLQAQISPEKNSGASAVGRFLSPGQTAGVGVKLR